MQRERLGIRGILRRCFLMCGFAAGIAVVAGTLVGPWRSAANAQQAPAQTSAFKTTVSYVVQFYPLWFTYFQSLFSSTNRLVGPERISPIYHAVVAINDDTLYASTVLSLESEPVILTIPQTTVRYSMLTLDPYGNIFESGIAAGTPGIYGFTGPGYKGKLPQGVTRIKMPLDLSILIFRSDKYTSTGQDLTKQSKAFRRSLKLQTLSDYQQDPSAGGTLILPEIAFALPVKTIADDLIKFTPVRFLQQLQTAVASSNTPPLSRAEQALSDKFNALFADRSIGRKEFSAGARAAHKMILDNYLTNTGRTNWITFTNIGAWGRNVLDRASITEFLQFGNGRSTAAYYHAFTDRRGRALDGTNSGGYILTFPKRNIPEAERFWSVTAYTPDSIELVPNAARKYVVAGYTPGLQFNSDGSVSIYMTTKLPAGIPKANWLPIPEGPFNIMLRVYGPEGKVADNTYVPPAIERR